MRVLEFKKFVPVFARVARTVQMRRNRINENVGDEDF